MTKKKSKASDTFSLESLLKDINLQSKYARAVLKAQRLQVRKLKLILKFDDNEARRFFALHYRKNGNRWDSKANKQQFGDLIANRRKVSQRIVRIRGSEKEIEFDSP